jgi:hypothetical protein
MGEEIDLGKTTDIKIVAKIEQYLNERMRTFQKKRRNTQYTNAFTRVNGAPMRMISTKPIVSFPRRLPHLFHKDEFFGGGIAGG